MRKRTGEHRKFGQLNESRDYRKRISIGADYQKYVMVRCIFPNVLEQSHAEVRANDRNSTGCEEEKVNESKAGLEHPKT